MNDFMCSTAINNYKNQYKNQVIMKRTEKLLYNFLQPVFDPLKAIWGLYFYFHYFKDWRQYMQQPNAEPIKIIDAQPQLYDRTKVTGVDYHYFYTNGWAMRRILACQPIHHIDIGSQTMFVILLSAVLPVTFVDYRPLKDNMDGLTNCSGDILHLPFADGSIISLSCLHVAEHIGLGRYGESLNPDGTRLACKELQRILAPGGNLYFVLPVGRQRICFNAHRIHYPEMIMEYFPKLELVEFSGVHDDGRYMERVGLSEFTGSHYACGMYWLRKPVHNN
jgi:SAM-dependent methyltransferase